MPRLYLLLALLCLAGCGGAATFPIVAPTGPATSGTAFFVRQDGLLVTAAHVVEDCSEVQIASARLPAHMVRVLDRDDRNDLALIQADRIRAPGVIGLGPASGRSVAFGYGNLPTSPLGWAVPATITDRVVPPSPDPRFAVWWQNTAIDHGWSGGPVTAGGQLAGVILSVLPDPTETARILGRAERGVAAGAAPGAVAALLARTGLRADSPRAPQDAVVRVFCRK